MEHVEFWPLKLLGITLFYTKRAKHARCTRAQNTKKIYKFFTKKMHFFFRKKIFFFLQGGVPPQKGAKQPKRGLFWRPEKVVWSFLPREISGHFGHFWPILGVYNIYSFYIFVSKTCKSVCVCVCVEFYEHKCNCTQKRRFVLERNTREVRNVTFQPGNIRAQKKEPAREKGA